MRVLLKWFLTGKVTELEESDDLLNPSSTILEVKGLIQLKFGFLPRETLLISHQLLPNDATLRSVGVVGGQSDPTLTAHVIRSEKLESSNIGPDDTSRDDDLQEFSHDDFVLAMKMLGKDVPVSTDRLKELRGNAPRQRPAFLNVRRSELPTYSSSISDPSSSLSLVVAAAAAATHRPSGGMAVPAMPPAVSSGYNPKTSEVYRIFDSMMYGMRREGVDDNFAVHYPGVPEPYQFWDMRLPDAEVQGDLCAPSEVCLELFFFGEFACLKNKENFKQLVRQMLEMKCGFKLRTPLPIREAGCMYPLVTCPVVLSEVEAMELGHRVFEDFGKPLRKSLRPAVRGDSSVAGNVNRAGCSPQ